MDDYVGDLTEHTDRRRAIADAALDLAAEGGNRAVTHGAVDRALELPKGSTSYYFRTRRALLDAALAHLAETSSASFATSTDPDPADVVGAYLHTLTTTRSRDVHARFALAPDAAHDDGLAERLRDALFSRSAATALFVETGSAEPEADADDLLVFCEGVAATHLFSGSEPTARSIADAVRRRFGLTSQ